MRVSFCGFASMAVFALMLAPTAGAQQFPTRPVRLVVANPAGAPVDRMARAIVRLMDSPLGQPVVVDNKAGGLNVIGVSEVLRSPPDGYTVGHTCLTSVVNLPFIMDKPPFDFAQDSSPVGMMGGLDVVIAARADNPVNTIEEYVAMAKANPGRVSFGAVQAVASIAPVAYLNQKAAIDVNLVTYKAEADTLLGILGGDIQFGIQSLGSALTQLKAGKIKVILALTDKRNPALPNTPSVADTKVQAFAPNTFCVMYAPKATPGPILEKLNSALNVAGKDKELIASWVREGLVAYIGDTVAGTSKVVRDVAAKWNSVMKEIDLSKYR